MSLVIDLIGQLNCHVIVIGQLNCHVIGCKTRVYEFTSLRVYESTTRVYEFTSLTANNMTV